MSKRISNELNEVINNHKSCFNCLNFKIKPFKYNDINKQINIDFKFTENTGRCVKGLFNTNIGVRSSIVSKNNKPIILRDAMKSVVRYKKMAKTCDKYEGEDASIIKTKPIRNTKRVKYTLVKYLF